MHPLRIAILWHFHQPDYRTNEGFVLPWVRLHATKDYSWLPELFAEYPSVRHTINIVPSLLDQLAAYGHGTSDILQQESARLIQNAQPEHPELFARALTVLNASRMITHPHHDVLHQEAQAGKWRTWSVQQWIDLSVWYHLAWCNPSLRRNDAVVNGLLAKGLDFTSADLHALLDVTRLACGDVVATLRKLHASNSLDLSVTPYHHPILPLICNTDVTREALPSATLPIPSFVHSDDARVQISSAIESASNQLGLHVQGMWPAEGSISNEALQLFAQHGIRWVASDEGILEKSLGAANTDTSKYRAWRVGAGDTAINVLFRDRALSDVIGFVYSSWEAERAADDFLRMLEERRRLIVQNEGEAALADTIVTVILDGENCWEFYPDNGETFLRALCERLSDTSRFACIGMNDAARTTSSMDSIVAGSWIGGSFDIWIGSPLKNLAWSILREARICLDAKEDVDPAVWYAMMSAESSDWFWWYDERHEAPNKKDFDLLFRARLRAVFQACNAQPSIDLEKPLYETVAAMHEHAGQDSTVVHVAYGSVAMHSGNQLVHSIRLEGSGEWHRVTVRLERKPKEAESISLELKADGAGTRTADIHADGIRWQGNAPDETMQWQDDFTIAIYVRACAKWTVEVSEETTNGQRQAVTIELGFG